MFKKFVWVKKTLRALGVKQIKEVVKLQLHQDEAEAAVESSTCIQEHVWEMTI